MSTEDIILKLTKQLFPSGRAFKLPKNSIFQKLMYALGLSEARAYDFALSTLDRILPDNDNFTADDATLWERRLNITIQPAGLNLAERKIRINRKYAFPGTAIYRQNYRFLQDQLQKYGFNVYVHENRFPDGGGYVYVNVLDDSILQHSDTVEHGYQSEMGSNTLDLIANSADPNEEYSLGTNPDNMKGLFFIGGETYPDTAKLDINQLEDFRKLVLLLKPAATVAILLLEYVAGGNMLAVSGDNLISIESDNMVSVEKF